MGCDFSVREAVRVGLGLGLGLCWFCNSDRSREHDADLQTSVTGRPTGRLFFVFKPKKTTKVKFCFFSILKLHYNLSADIVKYC